VSAVGGIAQHDEDGFVAFDGGGFVGFAGDELAQQQFGGFDGRLQRVGEVDAQAFGGRRAQMLQLQREFEVRNRVGRHQQFEAEQTGQQPLAGVVYPLPRAEPLQHLRMHLAHDLGRSVSSAP